MMAYNVGEYNFFSINMKSLSLYATNGFHVKMLVFGLLLNVSILAI